MITNPAPIDPELAASAPAPEEEECFIVITLQKDTPASVFQHVSLGPGMILDPNGRQKKTAPCKYVVLICRKKDLQKFNTEAVRCLFPPSVDVSDPQLLQIEVEALKGKINVAVVNAMLKDFSLHKLDIGHGMLYAHSNKALDQEYLRSSQLLVELELIKENNSTANGKRKRSTRSSAELVDLDEEVADPEDAVVHLVYPTHHEALVSAPQCCRS